MIILSVFNPNGKNEYRLSIIGRTADNLENLKLRLPRVAKEYSGDLISGILAMRAWDCMVDLVQYAFANDNEAYTTAKILHDSFVSCTTATNRRFFKIILARHLVEYPPQYTRPADWDPSRGLDTFKVGEGVVYGLEGSVNTVTALLRRRKILEEYKSCGYDSGSNQNLGLLTTYAFGCKSENTEGKEVKEFYTTESRCYKGHILAHLLAGGVLYFVVDGVESPTMLTKVPSETPYMPATIMRKQITASELSYASKLRGFFPGQIIYIDINGAQVLPPWENVKHSYNKEWSEYVNGSATRFLGAFFSRRGPKQPDWRLHLLDSEKGMVVDDLSTLQINGSSG